MAKEMRGRREEREPKERKMTGNKSPWDSGDDASYIKPKLIPDDELLGRDDSGGIGYEPYTQKWGDGGYVTGGTKAHLSAHGGSEDPEEEDEESSEPRMRAGRKAEKEAR